MIVFEVAKQSNKVEVLFFSNKFQPLSLRTCAVRAGVDRMQFCLSMVGACTLIINGNYKLVGYEIIRLHKRDVPSGHFIIFSSPQLTSSHPDFLTYRTGIPHDRKASVCRTKCQSTLPYSAWPCSNEQRSHCNYLASFIKRRGHHLKIIAICDWDTETIVKVNSKYTNMANRS